MGIPPHAARLAGAWAVRSTAVDGASATEVQPVGTSTVEPAVPLLGRREDRRVVRDRSRRTTVSRILHPLHRHA